LSEEWGATAMPYCDSQGVGIHYHLEGNPAGPPLVLLHGWAMSLQDWHDEGYVSALAAYRLILVDPRGHGASDSHAVLVTAYFVLTRQTAYREADRLAMHERRRDHVRWRAVEQLAALGYVVALTPKEQAA
jgi:pimeloyl-ACP methyl ester carboxylesterase